MASAGATAEWIKAVGDAGVDFDGDTLVSLASLGVQPEWIRAVGDAGVDLDGDTLVALASLGASPDVIAAIIDAAEAGAGPEARPGKADREDGDDG